MPKFIIEPQVIMHLPEELHHLEDGDDYYFIANGENEFALFTRGNYEAYQNKLKEIEDDQPAKNMIKRIIIGSDQVSLKNHSLILPMHILRYLSSDECEQEFEVTNYPFCIRLHKKREEDDM